MSDQCRKRREGESCAACKHFMECEMVEHLCYDDVVLALRSNDVPKLKKILLSFGIEDDSYSGSPELFSRIICPLLANTSEDLLTGTGATEDTAKEVLRMLSSTIDLMTLVNFLPTMLDGDRLKTYLKSNAKDEKVWKMYQMIMDDKPGTSFNEGVAALNEVEFFGLMKVIKTEKPTRIRCSFDLPIIEYCLSHELIKLAPLFYILALSAHDYHLRLVVGALESGLIIRIN